MPIAHLLKTRHAVAAAVLAFAGPFAQAATVSFTGNLTDPTNKALVYYDLSPAVFFDDLAKANNVALYTFSVLSGGAVTIATTDGSSGLDLPTDGVDPYVTLFSGVGTGAVFAASNYAQAFSHGGDISLSLTLAAGNYTVALGTYANESVGETRLSPSEPIATLGEGFSGLGQAAALGTGYYNINVTGNVSAVPEPETLALMLAGVAGIGFMSRRRNGR